jgi:hypothetical protein
MSLHLHHVPHADMLECRLEILLIVPHPKNLHICICSPSKRGQYNNILAIDTYLVAFVKSLYYMTYGRWISWVSLHKANFILKSFAKLYVKILFKKGQNSPHTLHTGRYVVLGDISTKLKHQNHHPSECMLQSSCLRVSKQILKHSETVMRFFRIFYDKRLNCP